MVMVVGACCLLVVGACCLLVVGALPAPPPH